MKEARVAQTKGYLKAASKLHEKLGELLGRFPHLPAENPPPSYMIYRGNDSTKISNPIRESRLEWLHWNRFHKPLWQDKLRANDGDITASKRITQTFSEYDDWRENPNWTPVFKRDLDHNEMFQHGIGLGLNKLNQEEFQRKRATRDCPHRELTRSIPAFWSSMTVGLDSATEPLRIVGRDFWGCRMPAILSGSF